MKNAKQYWGFIAGIVIGILLFGVFAAIGIFVTINIPVAIAEPPIEYFDLDMRSPTTVCAGDAITYSVGIRFSEPALVKTYISIRDPSTGRNVPGTQSEIGVRPQPQPIELSDTLHFVVPSDLVPGSYEHLRSTISINMDAKPAYLRVPFTVKPCP